MVYVFFIGLVIGLCLILAASAIFCATGFKRVTMRDIDALAKAGNGAKLAQQWRRMIMQQDKIVSTFLVAYLFLVITLVTLMAYFWLTDFSLAGVFVHIICVTVFILVTTYYIPKAYVLRQESGFILNATVLLQTIYAVFSVPAWIVTVLGNGIASLFKNHFSAVKYLVAAEHDMNFIVRYRGIMAAQDPEGLKEAKEQRRMVKSLEEYLDKRLSDVMLPIAEIPMIDGEQAMEELVEIVMNSQHPRMLMYQETPDQMVGILHVDLFIKAVALAEGDLNAVDLMSAISEPFFVPATRFVTEQIHQFKVSGQGFALIRDKQGKMVGGVSLDGLLEQTTLLLIREDEQEKSGLENNPQEHNA